MARTGSRKRPTGRNARPSGLTRRTLGKRPLPKKGRKEKARVGEPQIGPRLEEAD